MIEFYRDEQGVSVIELAMIIVMIACISAFIGIVGFVLYGLGIAVGVF